VLVSATSSEHSRNYANPYRLVSSVHAFAQSPVKPYFTTFLITATGLRSLPFLASTLFEERSEARKCHLARVQFLFNNLICCELLLFSGHLVPGVMEALTGEKETIDAPYYNRVNVPIALFLIFLKVWPIDCVAQKFVCQLRKSFAIPSIVGLAVMAGCLRRAFMPFCGDFVWSLRFRTRLHRQRILERLARYSSQREAQYFPLCLR